MEKNINKTDLPAFPCKTSRGAKDFLGAPVIEYLEHNGISQRTYIATKILSGLISNSGVKRELSPVNMAIALTDELISKLNLTALDELKKSEQR